MPLFGMGLNRGGLTIFGYAFSRKRKALGEWSDTTLQVSEPCLDGRYGLTSTDIQRKNSINKKIFPDRLRK